MNIVDLLQTLKYQGHFLGNKSDSGLFTGQDGCGDEAAACEVVLMYYEQAAMKSTR
jgi:hypothetical protein